MTHQISVSDHERTIANSRTWYRSFVRVATYPFRTVIKNPFLSMSAYFLASAGLSLFCISQSLLEMKLDTLNSLGSGRGDPSWAAAADGRPDLRRPSS